MVYGLPVNISITNSIGETYRLRTSCRKTVISHNALSGGGEVKNGRKRRIRVTKAPITH